MTTCRRTDRFQLGRTLAVAFLVLLPAAVTAQNVATNPSAEQVAADGTPVGWGMYVGAGQMKLTAAADQKHTGQRSACLEFTRWYTPPGAADVAANHSISGAMVLAPNDGYSAKGAIPCRGGTSYAFSFWYKGNVPSASVSATGWPSATAGDTQRISLAVSQASMSPDAEWRKCSGRLRITEGVERFALMIHVLGKEQEGFRLGKLYVDDVEIVPHDYPDGELRAVWCALPKAAERDAARREIAATLDKVKSGGFNALFVWTQSRYLAALERPDLQKIEPQAAWDVLGELIRAAKERAIQVHMWYSPWIYKSSGAVELADHPQWAAITAKGVASKDGLCFIRPEVRRFELELIGKAIDRYADLAGVHIEEPGFDWGPDFCYCDHCRHFCQQTFATDIRQNPPAAKAMLNNLAAFMCSDFFARLREMAMSKRPSLWLSANGCGGANPDWYLGRDWATWARRGYLDFYVPQLYARSVDSFLKDGRTTKSYLADCDMVTGMAVSWSGIYPARQPPELIQAQIAAARKLGAKGFSIFHLDYFGEEHYRAVRAAAQEKSGPAPAR
jgi:uncharacterized lipoprotein YddW (UPF0748 family)